MDPFRDYRRVVSAATRHCPSGRCAVCCSAPTLVHQEFADMVRRSWSPAELCVLRKAADAALL
jgi:hypothetical protein